MDIFKKSRFCRTFRHINLLVLCNCFYNKYSRSYLVHVGMYRQGFYRIYSQKFRLPCNAASTEAYSCSRLCTYRSRKTHQRFKPNPWSNFKPLFITIHRFNYLMLCRIQPSLMALKFYTYCQHARNFFSCMQNFCERARRVEISLRQQAKNIKSFFKFKNLP